MKEERPKLFIGIEENNLREFISPCCYAAISLEPPCQLCCGVCGKPFKQDEAVVAREFVMNFMSAKTTLKHARHNQQKRKNYGKEHGN